LALYQAGCGDLRVAGDYRRAAVAFQDCVAEEEELSFGDTFVQLGKFIGDERTGGAIFGEGIEGVWIAEARRTHGHGLQRLRRRGADGSERKKFDEVLALERVGFGAEESDIVIGVLRDDVHLEKAWRSHGAAKDDVWLGVSAGELAEDVGSGEEIAVAIDEEGVAVKDVMEAATGGILIDGIDDGADGERKVGIVGDLRGRRRVGG